MAEAPVPLWAQVNIIPEAGDVTLKYLHVKSDDRWVGFGPESERQLADAF